MVLIFRFRIQLGVESMLWRPLAVAPFWLHGCWPKVILPSYLGILQCWETVLFWMSRHSEEDCLPALLTRKHNQLEKTEILIQYCQLSLDYAESHSFHVAVFTDYPFNLYIQIDHTLACTQWALPWLLFMAVNIVRRCHTRRLLRRYERTVRVMALAAAASGPTATVYEGDTVLLYCPDANGYLYSDPPR